MSIIIAVILSTICGGVIGFLICSLMVASKK